MNVPEPVAGADRDDRTSAHDDLLGLFVAAVEEYAIIMLDPSGHVTSWNPGAERIKGYRSYEIVGRHFSTFYPPEDVAARKPEQILALATAEGNYVEEGWRLRAGGERFWASVTITALRDPAGALLGFSKITRDLTERRAAELELRASEERFRLMVEGVQDYAILMLDATGRVATWNAGAERIKGYRRDEIVGRSFATFYVPDDVEAGKPERLLRIAATEGRAVDEGWRVRNDGTRFWANVVITALRNADGELTGYGKITRDLTERKRYESRLEFLADHDPLTGVHNRRGFLRALDAHVRHALRYGPRGALLMIDLDHFKSYNDTRGHGAGDELLTAIARGIERRLRTSDVVARLGGDEFAALLPEADERGAALVIEDLLGLVREIGASGRTESSVPITASIGVASFADERELSADRMLRHADAAMYVAKRRGRNRWSRYRRRSP